MKKNTRHAVTLRFNSRDIKLLTMIVQKEFGHSDLKKGLQNVVINTAQAYLNQLSANLKEKKSEGSHINPDGDSRQERPREDTDSNALAVPNVPLD